MVFITETVYCSILFLTIISHLTEGLNRFGCSFQNNAYAYRLTSIFGDDALSLQNINAKEYNSVNELNADLKFLYGVVGDVAELTVYNDVDELIAFYKSCTRGVPSYVRNSNFDSLFDSHQPIYRQGTPFHRLVTIFDQIYHNRTDFEAYSYFVTVDESLNGLQLSGVINRVNPNYFKPDRVAAVVKFMIGGRLGFFIIDPQATIQHVAVVMYDGQPLYGIVFPRTETRNRFTYEVWDNYITAFIEDNQGRPVKKTVYYIRYAFCGMLDRTQKLNILNLAGRIETKDKNGRTVNNFEFKLTTEGSQTIDFKWYGSGGKFSFELINEMTLEELAAQKGEAFWKGYESLKIWFNRHMRIPDGVEGRLEMIRNIGLDKPFMEAVIAKREAIEYYRNQLIMTQRDLQSTLRIV